MFSYTILHQLLKHNLSSTQRCCLKELLTCSLSRTQSSQHRSFVSHSLFCQQTQSLRKHLLLKFQRSYYNSTKRLPISEKAMADIQIQMIDLRSDTVTKPTPGMREAMANAQVGDDVYGEDPTINELQDRCAKLFGMEAALFVPTGTMGNLLAIMSHCDGRSLAAVVGHKSHILINEQGGIAQFAGVTPRTIENLPDGTFSFEEMKKLVQSGADFHHTRTALICLENTHNFCGGKALPMSFLKQVYEFAKENNVCVHTDGARVMNAAVSLGVPVSEIMKYSDSVNMCFSKGLAAPVGSVLAGNKEFIAKALRLRKALGGGMRQAGVIAAAALYSLDNILPRLPDDHTRAKYIAKALMSVNDDVIRIDLDGVHSNIVMIEVIKPRLTAADFCARVAQVTEDEVSTLGSRIGVKMGAIYPQIARIVTHNDLTQEMVSRAITKLQYVIKEFSNI